MLVLFIVVVFSTWAQPRSAWNDFPEGSQDREIALIDTGGSDAGHRACRLLLPAEPPRAAGDGTVESGTNIRISARKIYARVPSFRSERKFRSPNRMTGTDMLGLQMP